ncbi:hypothetical protein EDD16DRAFT_1713093 [Pisolithus croceorrhizus]|nr:hypothetical protein EV401DRAFT_2081663 [Pisolithus croceorrhizus]KAI6106773.1 hypothetical protein EDD16DRAFT_1713093 [Pisolithus croceorrhizus]KAI6168923.1 hypothetical protein EDD17DRAFT_1749334 [Pisolithus thermaeus]
MSQPLSHIPTPPATAVWGWSAVPDSAIQSDNDENKAVTKAKHDERQHQKKAQKDQKVAEEAVAQERAEPEHWEREENEHQEREAQVQAASQVEGTGSQSHDSVVSLSVLAEPDPAAAEGLQSQGGSLAGHMTCAQCARAEVNCTYELAKASKCGKKSCDQCLSMKEQCVPAGTKKVWKCVVLAESTSPRAGEKKKHVWAKSPEVEVVGGSLQTEKGKTVACDTSITGGLYAIATVIDWHTEEVVQLWQTVKLLGSLHHHMIESMAELLQETAYPELELPTESASEEHKEAKTMDEPGW